ncbi:MAG: XRE family transcriptional regulator, partial [Tissierellia bacterium]|nr:XRE family transcriptional regulator [Tissierellia bacterium]
KIPRLETFIRIANALNVPSDLLLIDVLKAGNVIKSSELSEKISKLPSDEQQRIFHVIEVMIKDAEK